MGKLILFVVALVAFAIPAFGQQDPGAGLFTNTNSSRSKTNVTVDGGTLVYDFTTAVDSVAFKVSSARADLCFDSDKLLAAAGAAAITLYYAMDPSNPVVINAFDAGPVPKDTNCLIIQYGTYWIDVTTGRAASQEPRVTITGRPN